MKFNIGDTAKVIADGNENYLRHYLAIGQEVEIISEFNRWKDLNYQIVEAYNVKTKAGAQNVLCAWELEKVEAINSPRKEVSLTVTSDDEITKKVTLKFSTDLFVAGTVKSKIVSASVFIDGHEKEVGKISAPIEEFNNFCLDLFNIHKQIIQNN